ncbi:hypothetical protein HPP92_022971 [Vanilla planifolia]|uniref:Uncharacterized protein n=1 Tax=Vanilla planifolia TaxID=51239 RepID=A0A835PZB0_VANPL|nr:hypothetical protein HPP92_023211 [Vanilla planifolia]KAG0459843.1 hypothetical protein HPP92_022971 [Vanilla planifolia]
MTKCTICAKFKKMIQSLSKIIETLRSGKRQFTIDIGAGWEEISSSAGAGWQRVQFETELVYRPALNKT